MATEADKWLVLSDMELNLAVRLLGRRTWRDLAVRRTAQQSQQQALNALFHLARLGLLEERGNAYQCSARVRELLGPVARAEKKLLIGLQTGELLRVYQSGGGYTLLRRLRTDEARYGVCRLGEDSVQDYLREALGAQEGSGLTPPPERAAAECLAEIDVRSGAGRPLARLALLRSPAGEDWLAAGEVWPYRFAELWARIKTLQ